jgi:Immunoglobulin-like domain of bacterial spore germination
MYSVAIRSLFVASLVLLSLVLVAPLGPPSEAATPDPSACPDNPSPPKPNNPTVIVDRPTENQRVTSPVPISGRAQVFEAHVSITIFDASGKAIVNTFTLAQEMAEVPKPFSTQVPFTVATEQLGCIRVFESSAKDGSPINVVQRSVILSPTLGPSVKPPSTGDGGMAAADDGSQTLTGFGQVMGIAAAASLVLLGGFMMRRLRA